MAKTNRPASLDLYHNRSRIKWIAFSISVVISLGSIFYTNVLVNQLKSRERRQIELFARALEYTTNENLDKDIYFITEEILFQNNSIPTILVNERGGISEYRNIKINPNDPEDVINQRLETELSEMRKNYSPIEINLRDPETNKVYATQYVYYRNSFLLSQLIYYPYIQLSVIAIFAFIAYLIFDYSKAAEQNRVWVGLAKETAHQLGTPISSLMAWVEYFREELDVKHKSLIDELDKDVNKLQVITERFSNIGSLPTLKEENVEVLIRHIVDYLRPRISPKISMTVNALTPDIKAKVNPPLFEWVIENLCKNAVDSIVDSGSIHINILKGSEGRVFIDIADTGKGISKSVLKGVFNPGFTTKKRGWGLGLTLAKRIIESYHKGRIFVMSSEEGRGTTFRIVLYT